MATKTLWAGSRLHTSLVPKTQGLCTQSFPTTGRIGDMSCSQAVSAPNSVLSIRSWYQEADHKAIPEALGIHHGRRSFLRSLCPTWDPRWVALTRPLNWPCSFIFFLQRESHRRVVLEQNKPSTSQNQSTHLDRPLCLGSLCFGGHVQQCSGTIFLVSSSQFLDT